MRVVGRILPLVYLAHGLGIEFGLDELRGVRWQMVSVLDLLPRGFVRSLNKERVQ